MTEQIIMEMGRSAFMTSLLVGAPVLGMALVLGLLVGVFQSVTQINEATLTFVPKILGLCAVLGVFGPWMIASMVAYTTELIAYMPSMVR